MSGQPDSRGVAQLGRAVRLVRAFLASTEDSRYHPIWYLAATTGLCRSEVLGLRWRDVALDAQRLQVRQTVRRFEHGFVLDEGQKSAGSGRTIQLDQRTIQVLRTQRDRVEELKAQAGGVWQDNDLVFPNGDGSLLRPDSVSKASTRPSRARISGIQPEGAAQFSDLVFGVDDENGPWQRDTADEDSDDDQHLQDADDDHDQSDEAEEDPE